MAARNRIADFQRRYAAPGDADAALVLMVATPIGEEEDHLIFKMKLQLKPFKAALENSKDELIKKAVGTAPEDKSKPLKNRNLVSLLHGG